MLLSTKQESLSTYVWAGVLSRAPALDSHSAIVS